MSRESKLEFITIGSQATVDKFGGAGTLARGIFPRTGTRNSDLAGKSARAPVRTSADWPADTYGCPNQGCTQRSPAHMLLFRLGRGGAA